MPPMCLSDDDLNDDGETISAEEMTRRLRGLACSHITAISEQRLGRPGFLARLPAGLLLACCVTCSDCLRVT